MITKNVVLLFLLLIFSSCGKTLLDKTMLNPSDISSYENNLGWRIFNRSYGYSFNVDSIQKAIELEIDTTKERSSFGAFEFILPGPFKGRVITVSAKIKTENVEDGYVGAWVRQDIKYSMYNQFYNMSDRGIKGTTKWKKYRIKVFLQNDVSELHFGGLLTGKGRAWFKDFRITLDGLLIDVKDRQECLFKEPSFEDISWLNKHAESFETDDFKSYTFLDSLVLDEKIVLLGEQTHSNKEFQIARNNSCKYLIENKGFDIICYEDFHSGILGVDFLINKIDSLGLALELLKEPFDYEYYNTQDNKEFVIWLLKNGKEKVQFFGIDMTSLDLPLQSLLFLNYRKNPKIQSLCEVLIDSLASDEFRVIDNLNFLDTSIGELKEAAKKSLDYDEYTSKQNIYLLRNLEQAVAIASVGGLRRKILRDSLLASNVLYIRNQNPNSKLVVFAHNAHIDNHVYSMGRLLKEQLPNEVISIGTASSYGSYGGRLLGTTTFKKKLPLVRSYLGTYEYYFSKASSTTFAIDLRKSKYDNSGNWLLSLKSFRSIGVYEGLRQFYYVPEGLPNLFDSIIYIKNVGPVNTISSQ